jgi:hypothetical protein
MRTEAQAVILLLALLTGSSARAAEGPSSLDGSGDGSMDVSGSEFGPEALPNAAEAAYQDLREGEGQEIWLEEAVFTEISPIAVPEVGIALPPDQEH